jgi:hypothetical protein
MRAPLIFALALLSACQEDSSFAEPAIIVFHTDTSSIAVPSSAAAGTDFVVTVETFGGGCILGMSSTYTRVMGSVVEVRPFNERGYNPNCPDIMRFLIHTATVRLDQKGTATIRIIGGQRPFQGNTARTGPAQIERSIVIQ